MKTKVKITPEIEIHSRDEAESVLSEYAQIAINLKSLTNRMDEELTTIRDRYQPDIDVLAVDLQNHTQALADWAQTNPSEFPKDRKSIEFANGTIGFRTGTPKLTLLSRAWTWTKVLDALRTSFPSWIRKKEEVDKEAILAHFSAWDKPKMDAWVKPLGLKVTQDESFYVDPNLTNLEVRSTTEAA